MRQDKLKNWMDRYGVGKDEQKTIYGFLDAPGVADVRPANFKRGGLRPAGEYEFKADEGESFLVYVYNGNRGVIPVRIYPERGYKEQVKSMLQPSSQLDPAIVGHLKNLEEMVGIAAATMDKQPIELSPELSFEEGVHYHGNYNALVAAPYTGRARQGVRVSMKPMPGQEELLESLLKDYKQWY